MRFYDGINVREVEKYAGRPERSQVLEFDENRRDYSFILRFNIEGNNEGFCIGGKRLIPAFLKDVGVDKISELVGRTLTLLVDRSVERVRGSLVKGIYVG